MKKRTKTHKSRFIDAEAERGSDDNDTDDSENEIDEYEDDGFVVADADVVESDIGKLPKLSDEDLKLDSDDYALVDSFLDEIQNKPSKTSTIKGRKRIASAVESDDSNSEKGHGEPLPDNDDEDSLNGFVVSDSDEENAHESVLSRTFRIADEQERGIERHYKRNSKSRSKQALKSSKLSPVSSPPKPAAKLSTDNASDEENIPKKKVSFTLNNRVRKRGAFTRNYTVVPVTKQVSMHSPCPMRVSSMMSAGAKKSFKN